MWRTVRTVRTVSLTMRGGRTVVSLVKLRLLSGQHCIEGMENENDNDWNLCIGWGIFQDKQEIIIYFLDIQ